MGTINGNDFVNRLNKLNNEIWIDGKRIDGLLSEHPAFKGIIKSKASLYDLQHDENLKDIMTFTSPTSGEQVGLSFLQPKTKEDLIKRRKMIEQWAKHTNGIMGRSPDYLNTVLMSFASTSKFLEGKDNCYAENLRAVYELAMEKDLSFTHTFISPQVNRSPLYFEKSKEPIAAKVVNTTDEGIVIKGARAEKRIETTFELNEIIRASIPAKVRETGGHPSKRTFQAIRIELNRELEVLQNTIDGMIDILEPGGRLCIITFHSLEDRIVKTAFNRAENPCTCPPEFPVCVCGKKSKGKHITKKAVCPSEEELETNSRSKSSKLRIFEKS